MSAATCCERLRSQHGPARLGLAIIVITRGQAATQVRSPSSFGWSSVSPSDSGCYVVNARTDITTDSHFVNSHEVPHIIARRQQPIRSIL